MKTTADVVIIGGGCMGASVAFHLAERGVTNVVLVEREKQLATGSTGRNAGGFRHQFSHSANIELSKESIDMMMRFEELVGTPIDIWTDGYLFLLSRESSVATFKAHVDLQRSHGVEVEWLTPAEAGNLAPGLSTDGVIAGTFCARDGIADPHGVTHGFARAAQAQGVEILRETEVTSIAAERGRVSHVETTNGTIQTPVVVNAAGPWAAQVGRLAGAAIPVVPERRHIFIAQPPGGGTWDDPTHHGRVPSNRIMVIDFDSTFYCHREGAGLLFGMGDPDEQPGFDITVRWDFLPKVIDVAVQRFPALGDAAVSRAWAGLYEMTPDHNPLIGPVPGIEGLFVIAGFSGHGFQHSPAAGRILADLVVGRDPGIDVSAFAPDRFGSGTVAAEHNVV